MPTRKGRPKQKRNDLRVAIWSFVVLGLVFGGPALVIKLTSKPHRLPPVATPTETVASCTGPAPRTPLRDPGPFAAPTDVDTTHVFVATIKTYCGDLLLKIDPKDAPDAARSFVFLARKRFYDGLTFDRILHGAAVTAGAADPGYAISGRAPASVAPNDVLLLLVNGRAAARFAILTATDPGIGGARIGTVFEGDRESTTTLSRLIAQAISGAVPTEPLYIIHIDIQEFERG